MKKTLLIILMILAISVIFILPQLPVQKLFDDSSESLIEADNSNEISQSRIAEKTKYRKDAQLVLEKIVELRDWLKSKSIENLSDLDKIIESKKWIFGHISYDKKNSIENLSSKNYDGISFPDVNFFLLQLQTRE